MAPQFQTNVAVDGLQLDSVLFKATDGLVLSLELPPSVAGQIILHAVKDSQSFHAHIGVDHQPSDIPVTLVLADRRQQLILELSVNSNSRAILQSITAELDFKKVRIFCAEVLPPAWLVQDHVAIQEEAPSELNFNTAAVPTPIRDVQGDARWPTMHQLQLDSLRTMAAPSIVFAGDSIVQQMVHASFYRTIETMGISVANLGIGGDQTQHVHWRILEAKLDQYASGCLAIVLLVGTNNHGHTARQVAEGILAIVHQFLRLCPSAFVSVVEMLPRGQKFNALRLKREQVNHFLRDALAKIQRTRFIETGNLLVAGHGDISPDLMHDFLHLTDDGYGKLARKLLPALFNDLHLTF